MRQSHLHALPTTSTQTCPCGTGCVAFKTVSLFVLAIMHHWSFVGRLAAPPPQGCLSNLLSLDACALCRQALRYVLC